MWKKISESLDLDQEYEALSSIKNTLKQVCIHFILKTGQRYNIFLIRANKTGKKLL
jgi:hypothetical protein